MEANLIRFSRTPSPTHPTCLVSTTSPSNHKLFGLPVNAARSFSVPLEHERERENPPQTHILDTSTSAPFPFPLPPTSNTLNSAPSESNPATTTTTTTDHHTNTETNSVSPTATFSASLSKWTTLLSRAVTADFADALTQINDKHARTIEEEAKKYADSVAGLTVRVRDLEAVLVVWKEKVQARNAGLEAAGRVVGDLHTKETLARCFSKWKSRFADRSKLHLAERMAASKARSSALRRALFGWQRVCGVTWRRSVEKSIRVEAEKAMVQLAAEYESRISTLQQELQETRAKLCQSELDRTRAQGDMKKALMRGVCALNMEAMSVFRPGVGGGLPVPTATDFLNDGLSPTTTLNASESIGISPINIASVTRGTRSMVVGDAAGKIYPKQHDSTAPTSGRTSPVVGNAPKPSVSVLALPEQPLFLKKAQGRDNEVAVVSGKEVLDGKRVKKGGITTATTANHRLHKQSSGRNSPVSKEIKRGEEPPLVQKAAGVATSVYARKHDNSVGVHVERHLK
ncbi:hypothetical protein BCR33DRAFT_841558 [Rhizoclosmatium globosum]|uniref:Centrosomal protein POC5 n=1 Tax=Rhizoclosmatium globosum TaxID=329046 RepID=A0A1Y2BA57_9FUNG|nr:hypothetical protein BCR33DRAFT_841558 [Rhizoclosmatium globosum]|eukprot:ORY30955.1 hypothetical protein BCR33DRAFT_841558 [Rhizoclosmatium globosum]